LEEEISSSVNDCDVSEWCCYDKPPAMCTPDGFASEGKSGTCVKAGQLAQKCLDKSVSSSRNDCDPSEWCCFVRVSGMNSTMKINSPKTSTVKSIAPPVVKAKKNVAAIPVAIKSMVAASTAAPVAAQTAKSLLKNSSVMKKVAATINDNDDDDNQYNNTMNNNASYDNAMYNETTYNDTMHNNTKYGYGERYEYEEVKEDYLSRYGEYLGRQRLREHQRYHNDDDSHREGYRRRDHEDRYDDDDRGYAKHEDEEDRQYNKEEEHHDDENYRRPEHKERYSDDDRKGYKKGEHDDDRED
jgi:hypothetical protein